MRAKPIVDLSADFRPVSKPKATKGVDMSGLPFGKINRRQRENKRARKEALRARCEIPCCWRRAQAGPHHVVKRSLLLIDHRLNLISLCDMHHLMADKYEIAQVDLFDLIAAREGMTIEQLLHDLGEYAGVSLYIEQDRVIVGRCSSTGRAVDL